eukprot:1159984-Pelagomonas_calceolata.AAC.5
MQAARKADPKPTCDRSLVVVGAQNVKVHLIGLHDLTIAQQQGTWPFSSEHVRCSSLGEMATCLQGTRASTENEMGLPGIWDADAHRQVNPIFHATLLCDDNGLLHHFFMFPSTNGNHPIHHPAQGLHQALQHSHDSSALGFTPPALA